MPFLKEKIMDIFGKGQKRHEPDFILIGTIGLILVFGLIMLSSASVAYAYIRYNQNTYFFFNKQVQSLLVGLVGFFFFSALDYRNWKRYALYLLFTSIILLVMVLIPGLSASDKARSWIRLGPLTLQPSEVVKLFFLLYLSTWLEAKRKLKQATGQFYILLGLVSFLMILQPDVGTLSIIVLSSLAVYFVSGESLKNISILLAIGIVSLLILLQLKPYQLNRFRCFLDSTYSRDDICYQTNQSLIAIGSGGIFGRGLGESRQKFMYLPEVYGDSIFAIIGEEVGLVFSGILVCLYMVVFYRGYLIARAAPDDYGQMLAIGIVSWFVFQAIINIGGMVNLMPMTGVPLPFVSYGGSAMVANLAALGILVNISKQTK